MNLAKRTFFSLLMLLLCSFVSYAQGGFLSHNTLYVADTSNNRIQKSTNQGSSWQTVGFGPGTNPGQFNQPHGVSADFTDTVIFVADTLNSRIQRSTDSGSSWQIIAGPGTAIGKVNGAQGVAYDEFDDQLYIADTLNSRIQLVTNASGQFGTPNFSLFASSGPGTAIGRFNQPRGIAVDDFGAVYVADTNNNRIQVNMGEKKANGISNSGWSIFQSATAGTAVGKMNSPRGIFVDDNFNVYVADTKNNRIQVNMSNMIGRLPVNTNVPVNMNGWSVVAGPGTAVGTVNAPEGVVISSPNMMPTNLNLNDNVWWCWFWSQNIFIGDTSNNRIQLIPMGWWWCARTNTNWSGNTPIVVGFPGTNVGLFNQPTGLR